jgi:D-aspartate ligase
MSSKVPVVVVGGTLNSLGVVRSLATEGMPIYLLETTRSCPAAWSRHCHFMAVASLEGRVLIEKLVTLASDLGIRPVLILTSDESVNTVSAERATIEPLYRISLPAEETVRTLADKALFQAFAEREGFAVPKAVCLASPDRLDLLEQLTAPLVVKPSDKTLVLKGGVERAVRVDSLAQAREVATRMLACAPQIIAQEWIEGADGEIFFTLFSCDRDGKVLGVFPGRKLVCSPPAVGSTAVCVAAAEVAQDLIPPTLQFITRVGYRGLGSLEFKRDARTGQFVIVEPTVGRTDWQEEIATLCGLNLPLLSYWGELNRPLSVSSGSFRPVVWRSSLGIRVPRCAQTQSSSVVDGYFRWSDPIPAVQYYGYERAIERLWRRIRL